MAHLPPDTMLSTVGWRHLERLGEEGPWRERDQDTGTLIGIAGDEVLAGENPEALLEAIDGEIKTLAVFAYGVLARAFRDQLLERNPNRHLFVVRLPDTR